MKMLYRNDMEGDLDEGGVLHCAFCGGAIDPEWRFYVRDGIPYCRSCILGFSVCEILRICEKGETAWLLEQGFEARGRLADGEY